MTRNDNGRKAEPKDERGLTERGRVRFVGTLLKNRQCGRESV